jgi:hypothetical protein
VNSSSQRPLPTQHTRNAREEQPCPQRDSNWRPQQNKRLQTYALDRTATGIGFYSILIRFNAGLLILKHVKLLRYSFYTTLRSLFRRCMEYETFLDVKRENEDVPCIKTGGFETVKIRGHEIWYRKLLKDPSNSGKTDDRDARLRRYEPTGGCLFSQRFRVPNFRVLCTLSKKKGWFSKSTRNGGRNVHLNAFFLETNQSKLHHIYSQQAYSRWM